MASQHEPSELDQLKLYIAKNRLDGKMDSASRAQFALAVSVPTELQKLFSELELEHVIKTMARAIDEAVIADRESR